MEDKKNWFGRPVAALCICLALIVVSFFVLLNQDSVERKQKNVSYMITLAIHGTDAREMERIAAIPLEDALSGIPGINKILTFSENSRVRAYAGFHRTTGNSYEAIREAAQRVYETLPPWAQRPVLNSSDESHIPVWTAAVMGELPGDYLEKVIKPALEGLDGTAEVEIAGSGLTEIVIVPDPEKIAELGLNPSQIAQSLGANDGRFPGGKLKLQGREFPVRIDGSYPDSASLEDAWISIDSERAVRLKDIAGVFEQEKEEDVLSRLNGKRTAVISIQAASGTELPSLSRRIKKELEKFSNPHVEFKILRDTGAEEEKAFRSVLAATAFAAILIALCAALLTGNYGRRFSLRSGQPVGAPAGASALICAFSIPFIALVSAALLACFGFPVNRKLLAGLSIGIGAAVDAVILCADAFGKHRAGSSGGGMLMAKLLPPLVSGGATTIAALLPLAKFSAEEDLSAIAWALGTVTLVSLVMSLTVLPPLFLRRRNFQTINKPSPKDEVCCSYLRRSFALLSKKGKRLLAAGIATSLRRPLFFPGLAALLTIPAAAALFFAGVDVSGSGSANSIYARAEFEGGFHKEEGDKLLSEWAGKLIESEGVESVQTSVRTGSAQIIINFDPRKIEEQSVREIIRSTGIPGAFVYIPESAQGERNWVITITGDDDEVCRNIAEEAASLFSALPFTKDAVLNFKPGNPRLSLIPDRSRLAREKLLFSEVSDTVRRAVHGPVIYKRPGEKGETDVRLRSAFLLSEISPDEIFALPLVSPDNDGARIARIDTQVTAARDNEPSMIRRENRRRTASFSIRTAVMDPRKAQGKTRRALEELKLPPGYTIEFDREAVTKAEALSGTVFLFLFSLAFCYMIIAAVNESFRLPLIILSTVPPSLAVPVLFLVVSGTAINGAVCCSLIAVCGITVNASVITAGEFSYIFKGGHFPGEVSFYRTLRKCLPCLIAVCGTTMAGALPFLFLQENSNSFVSTLSLVTFLGVGASLISSLTLIPSLIVKTYLHYHR